MIKKILRISGIVLILTLILAAIQVWHENTQLQNLIDQAVSPFKVSPAESSDIPAESQRAARLLQKGDWHYHNEEFEAAVEQYRLLQQAPGSSSHLVKTSEWNECVALYHIEGASGPNFTNLLSNIISDETHPFRKKAIQLRHQLDNFFVRVWKG